MTQVTPCNVEMYAVYGEGGEEFKSRIIAFGIDNAGNLRPIVFDSDIGCDGNRYVQVQDSSLVYLVTQEKINNLLGVGNSEE